MKKRLLLGWLLLIWPLFAWLPTRPFAAPVPQIVQQVVANTPKPSSGGASVVYEAECSNYTLFATSVTCTITLGGASSTRAVVVGAGGGSSTSGGNSTGFGFTSNGGGKGDGASGAAAAGGSGGGGSGNTDYAGQALNRAILAALNKAGNIPSRFGG